MYIVEFAIVKVPRDNRPGFGKELRWPSGGDAASLFKFNLQ